VAGSPAFDAAPLARRLHGMTVARGIQPEFMAGLRWSGRVANRVGAVRWIARDVCAALAVVCVSGVAMGFRLEPSKARVAAGQTQPRGAISVSDQRRLIGAAWLAEDIGGRGVIDNAQSTVAFEAGGGVSGLAGCNRLRGSARVEGAQLVFGPLATTRKMCVPALMDQERKFLAALAATRTFRFEGAYLRFYGAAGAELVRFTRLDR
jgi:heat shock protein HslJ